MKSRNYQQKAKETALQTPASKYPKVLCVTCWVLPLAAIAPQNGTRWGGQALQSRWRQNLLGSKLWQLGKSFLKVHLWQHPSSPTHTHKDRIHSIYTPSINNSNTEVYRGINSLVNRVKGLLQRWWAGFDLFGCGTFFVSLWRWQGGLCGWWRRERRGGEGLLPPSLHRKFNTGILFKNTEALHVHYGSVLYSGSVWSKSQNVMLPHLFGGCAFPVSWVRGVSSTGALQWGCWFLCGMCWWRRRLPRRFKIKGKMTVGCSFPFPLLFSLPLSLLVFVTLSLLPSASSFIAAYGNGGHCCLHFLWDPDWKQGEFGCAWCASCKKEKK